MKYIRLFFISNVLMLLSFSSCNYLDSEEYLHEVNDLNDIYTTRLNLRQAWAACYGQMPDLTDTNYSWPFSGCGDEGYAGRDVYLPLSLAQGKINSDNIGSSPINYWKGTYAAVRICCQFLENSHLANDRLLEPGEVESYNADVRFLRAYYYSLLMEMYGPFGIIDHTIDYSDDKNLPTSRNSLEECVNFLLSELDALIKVLPNQVNIVDNDFGRPSKGAAMAVKARVLLWAASPLVNGNSEYSNFVQPDGTTYFNQSYDENKWKLAAQAYKDIIDLGQYELLALPADTNTVKLGDFQGNNLAWPNGPAGIDPYKSFKSLFAGGKYYRNKEAIWQVVPGGVSSVNANLTSLGYPRGALNSNQVAVGRVCAIQKIVDAFFMNNGKSIDEEQRNLYVDFANASAGDDKYIVGATDASPIKVKFTGASVPNRVLNREARFYATIGFQNRGFKQESQTAPIYYADYRANALDGYIETDRPSVRSGYPIVKYVNDNDIYSDGRAFDKQCTVFRLAEMYLSYAEALNEYDPANPNIMKYLNLIRFRAGLPGYTLADKETNRARIKREKQVELAFENGKRYFDMCRWKDAEKVTRDSWGNSDGFGGSIFGCDYLSSDVNFYNRTVLNGYIFKKRNYFLPLSYDDVANHWGTLIQNPGW